ncbi:hypothetical protein AB205_0112320, partial [Aquarana catesbeiana]
FLCFLQLFFSQSSGPQLPLSESVHSILVRALCRERWLLCQSDIISAPDSHRAGVCEPESKTGEDESACSTDISERKGFVLNVHASSYRDRSCQVQLCRQGHARAVSTGRRHRENLQSDGRRSGLVERRNKWKNWLVPLHLCRRGRCSVTVGPWVKFTPPSRLL